MNVQTITLSVRTDVAVLLSNADHRHQIVYGMIQFIFMIHCLYYKLYNSFFMDAFADSLSFFNFFQLVTYPLVTYRLNRLN